MPDYRLFADGRPNGRCHAEETPVDGGLRVDFDAAVGNPRPSLALAGTVVLDDALGWRRLELESGDGTRRRYELDPDVELEVYGIPALYGITTRRLVRRGTTPSGRALVDVLRIDGSLDASRGDASYLWVSGQSWFYASGRSAAWLAVRPHDGVVRSVEGMAELEE